MGLEANLEQSDVILEFRSASKVFWGRGGHRIEALQEVSFGLRRGEFGTLIGPSGSGKSTLLRLAAGLEMPSSGSVFYGGAQVMGPDRERGFVFQSYSAFPWLTVRENIAFGLPKRSKHVGGEAVGRWLHHMRLEAFADSYPKELSGGMRQRLALARAMIIEPSLLLMDEPFGALDEHARKDMQELLLELVSHLRCTVLFVTHDIQEAILLGDRVFLLSARPGTLKREFAPPFAKPRERACRRSREFLELYDEIVEAFPA